MKKIFFLSLVILICFSLIEAINFYNSSIGEEIIDDCCCNVKTVLKSNNKELNPLLNELVQQRFFKYFKLNLYSDCPFFIAESFCKEGGCGICECNEDDVPLFWKQLQKTDLVEAKSSKDFSMAWKDKQEDMWIVQYPEEEMSYVNLANYQEGNTHFGKDGSVIWNAIYNENCFKGEPNEMCLEERIFYRLISGLHTSIATHIGKYWEFDSFTRTWKSNPDLLEKAVLSHPDRIQNLYFTFLFMLRAVQKAYPYLEEYDYLTGYPQEDKYTKQLMQKLLTTDILCSPNFDESILFSTPERSSLKTQFKNNFRNISRIMQCISCEKCKMFGTLQILGMGTALRILLDPDVDLIIERNEIIALINTIRQFSNSIKIIEEFQNQISPTKEIHTKGIYTIVAISTLTILSFFIFYPKNPNFSKKK